MAVVKLEVTHPRWDDYKLGDIFEIEESKITPWIRSKTKPYEPKRANKVEPPGSAEQPQSQQG